MEMSFKRMRCKITTLFATTRELNLLAPSNASVSSSATLTLTIAPVNLMGRLMAKRSVAGTKRRYSWFMRSRKASPLP